MSDDAQLPGTPHDDPEDCTTWYDGCNCTVGALSHNITRAELAEERVKELERVLHEVDETLTDMNWHTERGLLYRVRKARDEG
jgi:hypothetical protein